jgi:hypothetical protein
MQLLYYHKYLNLKDFDVHWYSIPFWHWITRFKKKKKNFNSMTFDPDLLKLHSVHDMNVAYGP